MITLDASVLIAFLASRDPHHRQAVDIMDSAGDDLTIHSLTLTEVLVGGARIGRGDEMLDDLTRMGVRVAGRVDGEPLRLAQLRAESGLKLPDCCVLDTALTTSSALATFDAKLAGAARDRGVEVLPVRID